MFKQLKTVSLVLFSLYVLLAVTHVWLNVGFDALGLTGKAADTTDQTRFRVGFLPVT